MMRAIDENLLAYMRNDYYYYYYCIKMVIVYCMLQQQQHIQYIYTTCLSYTCGVMNMNLNACIRNNNDGVFFSLFIFVVISWNLKCHLTWVIIKYDMLTLGGKRWICYYEFRQVFHFISFCLSFVLHSTEGER